MSYNSLLPNWAAVLRYTIGLPDVYGHPAKTWAAVDGLDDIPCRLMAIKGVEVLVGAEVVIADYKLFLQDVIINEQDRVVVLLASSIVIGTDTNEYVCIAKHTATLLDRPTDGVNYLTYWGAVGPGYGSAWLVGSAYVPALTYEILFVKDLQDSSTSHHKECLVRLVR